MTSIDFDKDVLKIARDMDYMGRFDYIAYACAIRDLLQGSAEPVACEDEGCPHYGTPYSHPDETFKREIRYAVLKWKDIAEALSPTEIDDLRHLMWKTHNYREKAGKSRYVDCVVVEADWPEYESTWKAIENRMTGNTRPQLPPEQQEELERLRKEVENKDAYIKHLFETGKTLQQADQEELAQLRAENHLLQKQAAQKYIRFSPWVRHHLDCLAGKQINAECICGLNKTMIAAAQGENNI